MDTNLTNKESKQPERNYRKISEEQRTELFRQVFQQGYKIREVFICKIYQVALKLEINYGSAKTLVFNFRKSKNFHHRKNPYTQTKRHTLKRCTYTLLTAENRERMRSFSTCIYMTGDLVKSSELEIQNNQSQLTTPTENP